MGQPAAFHAHLSYRAVPGAAAQHYNLQVNHPLNVDNVKVYLIGHGYAPVFRITDGTGHVVFNGPVPFIPVSLNGLTSEGVVKVPDARPRQLGFAGVFLPTTVDVGGKLESAFPAPYRPAVSLVSYAGNLGMNGGVAQSVYQLDTAGLHRLAVKPRPLARGSFPRCSPPSPHWPACWCPSWSAAAACSCAPPSEPAGAPWSSSAAWPGPSRRRRSAPNSPTCRPAWRPPWRIRGSAVRTVRLTPYHLTCPRNQQRRSEARACQRRAGPAQRPFPAGHGVLLRPGRAGLRR